MDEITVNGKSVWKRSALSVFVNHPFVGLIGWLAGIAGVVLAIYFYYHTPNYPDLVYSVNPARAAVVKQGAASRLAITFDGHPIDTDVSAAQLAIWNRGKQAVHQTAILGPFVIRTEPRVPILEATIRKESRDIIALRIDTARLSQGEVPLTWNILERNDGGLIQLVYAGNTDVRIVCQGVIEGQASIRELKYPGKINSPAEQVRQENRSRILTFITALFGLVFAAFSFWLTRRKTPGSLY